MKKYIGIMLLACLLAGCNKEQQNSEEEDCLVSLNMAGEITSSEAPLTKGSTDDLYLVQVNRGSSPFAFCVVDDPGQINLYLKKGTDKYRIIVCLIRNGKVKLGDYYSSANNSYKSYYQTTAKAGSFANLCPNEKFVPINYIYYNSVGKYRYYSNQSSTSYETYETNAARLVNITKADLYGNKYPGGEWYYGEINDYSPNGTYETLNMDLKRVGFILKFEVSGITDGEVTVKIYNSTKTFFNPTINTASYSSSPLSVAFYEARNAWLYSNDYMENFTLAVTWHRGIGITEDYGTKTIQIKRNCLNNIKISMGNNDQSAGMSVTAEAESSIGSESETIPVQ